MTAPFEMKQTEVATAFSRWLKRRNPPESFAGDEQAEADEAADLLAALMRYAPSVDAAKWVDRVTGLIAERTTYRIWPNVGEIRNACEEINGGSTNTKQPQGMVLRGDKTKLSHDKLFLLENTILPTARRWVREIPGLAHHGRQTLAYWGEEA